MEYFWEVAETIDKSCGAGFQYYGWQHLTWLGIFLALAAVSAFVYRRQDAETRKKMRLGYAVLLLADSLLKYIAVAKSHVEVIDYTPIQLCYFVLMLTVIHSLLNPEGKAALYIGNFLYLIGIPAGLSALLFPSWNEIPAFANAMSIHSFSSHILFVSYIIMVLAGGDIHRKGNTVWVSLLALCCMAGGVYAFDLKFHRNFMYLVKMSSGSPLAPFQALGDYRIGYVIILACLVVILYGIPWAAGKIFRR